MRAKIATLQNFNNEEVKNHTLKESYVTGRFKKIDDSFFYRCTFKNVTFESCLIWNTIFRDCKFVNSNFEEARCIKTSFIGSSLIGANFRDSRLKIVSFREANLKFADFTDSLFINIAINGTNMYGTIISSSELKQLNHGKGALNLDKSITVLKKTSQS